MQFKPWLMSQSEDENLCSVTVLNNLKPQLAKVAQQVYDVWSQNNDGYDEEHGMGGICHIIADEICGVLIEHDIECTTFSQTIGEQHVCTMAKFAEGVYSIDIPPSVYEAGAAYTWKKLPNITFEVDDVCIDRISSDPRDFDDYSEY